MEPFYHALKVASTACIGCTHCMSLCPTQAIRIKGGLATINKNACVDCGKCLKSCPQHAIYVEQDDFNQIFNFKHRIILLPTVLFGQFSEEITEQQIFAELHQMGHLGKSHTTLYGKEFLRASFHLVLLPGNRPLNTGTFSLADRPHCPVKTSHGPSSHFRP